MLKCELEQKLGKTLTNQEYSQYVRQEYLQKKYGTKQQKKAQKQSIVNFTFIDAKEEYLNTLEEKDKNYYKQNYEYVLKIDNFFVLFEKPDIKTKFCFGYGLNGVSTQEQYAGARSMQDYANTKEEYFLKENLEKLNQEIFDYTYLLKDANEQYELYSKQNSPFRCHELIGHKVFLFNNNYKKQCYIRFYADYEIEKMTEFEQKNLIKELTKDDLKNILAVYKQQKKNFEKRLQTYLKRYGLSKLHTWTYLVD